IGETMYAPRVSVKCEDRRHLWWEDSVVLFVRQAVWMLGRWLQRHKVNHIYEADAHVWRLCAKEHNSRERFHRRHIAAASNHYVGTTVVVRGPLPDTESGGAMRHGFVHREPLRCRLLSCDDQVDV